MKYPTTQDINSVDRLERTLRDTYEKIYALDAATGSVVKKLRDEIAKSRVTLTMAHDSFQANGSMPLNVTGLLGALAQPQFASIPTVDALPAQGSPLAQDTGVVRYHGTVWVYDVSTRTWVRLGTLAYLEQGTFAARPAVTTADNGRVYYSTDFDVYWQVVAGVWKYMAGIYYRTQAQLAALTLLLGANDTGMRVYITDYYHILRWLGGVGWQYAPEDDGAGYIVAAIAAPAGNLWGVCDGSAYNMLQGDGTLLNVTTPNLTSDVFIKGGVPGAVQAATAPTWDATAKTEDESTHTHTVTADLNDVEEGVVIKMVGTQTTSAGSAHSHALADANAKIKAPSEANGGLPKRINLEFYIRL